MIQVGSIVYATDFPRWGWAIVEELKAETIGGEKYWRIRFFDDLPEVSYTWAERGLTLA